MQVSSISNTFIPPGDPFPLENEPEPPARHNFADCFFVRQMMEMLKKKEEEKKAGLCDFDPVQMAMMQSMINMSYINAYIRSA